jgi:hypothetical protein
MTVVSSLFTFPPISWWMRIAPADVLVLDSGENFQKMSYRNRYRISGSNNPVLLTVPLVKGRDQHTPVKELLIYNDAWWQVQHWRTLVSVYRRSPYFDHYEPALAPLFEEQYTRLIDFNMAGISWIMQQLKLDVTIEITENYVREYPAGTIDLRNIKEKVTDLPRYYQVFEDRTGFIPDLSILDLLFSEGPATVDRLTGWH